MRLPIRARLTAVTAVLVACALAGAGAFLYLRMEADLIEAVDAGLRSRADAILGRSAGALSQAPGLVEPDEAFAQVLGADGEVIDSSPGLGALLPREVVAGIRGPRFVETVVTTAEEPVPARLLALPAGEGRVLVVGASLEDQKEALSRLAVLLAVGGPFALALLTGVGWLVAGSALRPVEALRREAAAISASEPERRLPDPGTGDELARLAQTLNAMLARLHQALERERRFVGDASHELRTPLANLRAELELALRGSRTPAELEAALRSAAEETERLVRLAEDLLVLARAEGGRVSVRPEPVDVGVLVGETVERFAARAASRRVAIEVSVPDGLLASLDPLRMRQALGNVLDNALRHTPSEGRVIVQTTSSNGFVSIEVKDTGDGFPDALLPGVFEPFSRGDASRSRASGGTGLGLAIVRAVAEAHGGTAEAHNLPGGGAVVRLRIPASGALS